MQSFFRIVLLSVVAALAGCGGHIPVRITLTLDGKPLDNADVMLVHQKTAVKITGKTDAQGVVEPQLNGKTGLYFMTVTKTEIVKNISDEGIAALKQKDIDYKPPVRNIVPECYTKEPMLRFSVTDSWWEDRDFEFDISSNNKKSALAADSRNRYTAVDDAGSPAVK